jgi:predicted outer membrane repeat protein
VKRAMLASLGVLLLVAHSEAATITVADSAALTTALANASTGDVVELLSGTYVAPAGGFEILDSGASFTVRAADGAVAVLSGGGSSRIMLVQNLTGATGQSVVIEDLVFERGYSSVNGRAGGVTIVNANATLRRCTFEDNVVEASSTGGGAIFAFGASTVFIDSCTFTANTSTNEGGAIRVDESSEMWVHGSVFEGNLTNVTGHRVSAAGGAIHMTRSKLVVGNSRFVDNRAGCIGGAIFALGLFDEATASVVIANSTFVDNAVVPQQGVTCRTDPGNINTAFNPVGGAFHSEDNVESLVSASRFEGNSAEAGGAISQYRTTLQISESVFRDNIANGSGSTTGFGGTVFSNSNDSFLDGSTNRPSAALTITGSLLQGRTQGGEPTATVGGCLYVEGDANRTFGRSGVAIQGTPGTNRAAVTIEDSAFVNCIAQEVSTGDGTGAGGAITFVHADATLTGNLLLGNSVVGSLSSGGAMRAIIDSTVDVNDSVMAFNQSDGRGGAIHTNGSTLNLTQSTFFGNVLSSGVEGATVWSRPSENYFGQDHDMEGVFQDCVFADNSTRVFDERDIDGSGSPINDIQYVGGLVYSAIGGGNVYSNQVAGAYSVNGMNGLTVNRTFAPDTNKTPGANLTQITVVPDIAEMIAVPPRRFGTLPPGDGDPPSTSFLVAVWNGQSPTLDGEPLAQASGWSVSSADAGNHTLAAGDLTADASISDATIPQVFLDATPISIQSGESSDISWTTTGSFLDLAIDRGVDVMSVGASGSESVSPSATLTFTGFVVTGEGTVVDDVTVYVGETPPEQIFSDGFESGDVGQWSNS